LENNVEDVTQSEFEKLEKNNTTTTSRQSKGIMPLNSFSAQVHWLYATYPMNIYADGMMS
jgi:hypothetical protein